MHNPELPQKIRDVDLISTRRYYFEDQPYSFNHFKATKADALDMHGFTESLHQLVKTNFTIGFDYQDFASYFFGPCHEIITVFDDNNLLIAALGLENWEKELSQSKGFDLPPFCYINSMVVDSKFRKFNITNNILKYLAEEINPELICAIAVNPAVVFTVNLFKGYGYTVFPSPKNVLKRTIAQTTSIPDNINKIAKDITLMRLGNHYQVEESMVMRQIVTNPFNNPSLWNKFAYGNKYLMKQGDGVFLLGKRDVET